MKRNVIEGTIQGNERGFGFLIPIKEGMEDYFIPHGELRGAMHGDVVLAEITSGGGKRTTARVLKIIERGVSELSGTYFSCKSGGFVTPDDRKYFCDIFIPFGKGLRAKSGDKVACKILSYPKKKNPEGIISKIFGRQFNLHAELASLYYSFKLPEKFPDKVIDEAKKAEKDFRKDTFKQRKDFRDLITVTIDGEDARDFDDAVSIEKTKDGYVLGVHIADVTNYVTAGSALDKEAFKRGTSVYFPEKVVPMLPNELCNGICSLVEGQDRWTLSCVMTIDKTGKVIKSYITPSVIKSRARLTYTAVQKMFDGDKNVIEQYSQVVNDILTMRELSKLLIARREKNGAVDLDVKESAISVDKTGKITVQPASRDEAHRLIEEFMILANVTVANTFFNEGIPFVYRTHGKPDEEKRNNFYDFLRGIGVKADYDKEVTTKTYQNILKSAEGTPAYTVINRVMLRSMQKAKYTVEDIGHFGLGEEHYCHFTSPIRRYPDLVIHRIIKDYLKNGKKGLEDKYGAVVSAASVQSSETERNAIEAERAVDEYYKMMYIGNYLGEEFTGVVSGVTAFGIFVELESGVEGLVKVETLGRSKPVFNEKSYSLTMGKRSYRLGQTVKIRVENVDYLQRRAEFVVVEDNLLLQKSR